ncbi:Hypothetical Protein FCC1311_015042 [Hondaea fermentalgiana]|uniref:Uncharacterized protein n=1 Tax=Hondaea fermentalgiana TaxID=2315210 RepID=A0A2R5G2N4_9STRA|nr:Hypothetical Protein FCC1311_015042 [Hondaea fermentalgiana]|eukprot:GBG25287.1 Hypothetical Protein FCC1311_015042 [Hondaea fermentalgiana]
MSLVGKHQAAWADAHEGNHDAASHVVHVAFIVTSLNMALWTIYLDYRYFYGWSNGAWMFKFSHWSLLFTIFYLAVSTLDALTFGLIFGAPRRWVLYTALVLALMIDLNYFVVLIGRKVLRIDQKFAHITPVSTHKHVLNIIWLLGDVGTKPIEDHSSSALVAAGVVVPTIVCGAYLTLAQAIRSKKQAPKVLDYLGVPYDEDWERRRYSRGSVSRGSVSRGSVSRGNVLRGSISRLSVATSETESEDGLRRVAPGRWIYSSFKYRKLRSVFILQPLVYAPLAWVSLAGAERVIGSHLAAQVTALILAMTVTPILYGPELWRRHRATLFQAVLQTKNDIVKLLTYIGEKSSATLHRLGEWWKGVRERSRERNRQRREKIKRMIPKVVAALRDFSRTVIYIASEILRAIGNFFHRHWKAIEHFFTFTLPQVAIYSLRATQDLAHMVYKDMRDAADEVYDMIESVELEEHE